MSVLIGYALYLARHTGMAYEPQGRAKWMEEKTFEGTRRGSDNYSWQVFMQTSGE